MMTGDENQKARLDGRRVRGDATRTKVLASSVAQASRVGLQGLSLGAVAEDAGVSKATVSGLFGDKEGVQLATLEAALDQFRQWIGSAAQGQSTKIGVVEALFGKWFAFVSERELPGGCFMHATLSEFRQTPGVVQARVKRYRTEWRSAIHRLLRQAQDSGEIHAGVDVDQLAFDLFACQAAADTALFYDDVDTFERARKTVELRLRQPRDG